MAYSNFKNAYYDIYTINNYFNEIEMALGNVYRNTNKLIHRYCHYGNGAKKDNCRDYFQMASSGVIHLLKTLRDKHHLEYDKLAEYAILWLSYKLNTKPKDKMTDLNKFYTNYIENNKYYNDKIKDSDSMTYKEIINRNKDLMNIKELSKFNLPFHILFYLNYVYHDERLFCQQYSGHAKTFVSKFEELNKSSQNIEGSSYTKLLSTLSDDYKNLKKKYHDNNKCTNFPSLSELTPKKSIAEDIVENTVDSSVEKSGKGSLEISAKGSEQILEQTLEVTSSSSSILSTLIPGLSVVSVIPVFLGIAYKYSLFGVDKLFQRQYLRKKLKKVKKKMKLNI
ncbi:CIR protein PIR protein [Plasmodium vinckei]|uniref:CIR protein PIR protein n=1 Tax=Plasmodium vinckei TaxID=5860 RepID=A0A6V7SB58_PLAVN|nr:CIR protein PIR protein [Plasmodium vinckei]